YKPDWAPLWDCTRGPLRRVYTSRRGLTLMVRFALATALLASFASAQPYKILKTVKTGGPGGFDYVYADPAGRRLYIARSGNPARVTVFNLDTLEAAGEIANTSARGAAVSTESGHGFA